MVDWQDIKRTESNAVSSTPLSTRFELDLSHPPTEYWVLAFDNVPGPIELPKPSVEGDKVVVYATEATLTARIGDVDRMIRHANDAARVARGKEETQQAIGAAKDAEQVTDLARLTKLIPPPPD